MYFYVVVFSKSMSCKYFHVRSNLSLIGFEYFLGKTLHVEGNSKFEMYLQVHSGPTMRAMSRTDREFQTQNEFE